MNPQQPYPIEGGAYVINAQGELQVDTRPPPPAPIVPTPDPTDGVGGAYLVIEGVRVPDGTPEIETDTPPSSGYQPHDDEPNPPTPDEESL